MLICLKQDAPLPTSTFSDILYSYNMFPLIAKPKRVTKDTATLIDHILINNLITILSTFNEFHVLKFR